jgi:hypothetical protein
VGGAHTDMIEAWNRKIQLRYLQIGVSFPFDA